MRLLKTQDYQLVEANDIPIPFPQYAILSHTWISPKDEITYQDLKQRKGDIENDVFKQKGWDKLRKYCDRANKDGWEWAWMDTCCIDKTNPADTQEAINAMFRWYQNAGICYAYFDDVDVDRIISDPDLADFDLDDIAGRNNVTDSTSFTHEALGPFLTKAKWFTRGWTLQELLAPPYLVFVDQEWRRIGTRESWAEEIRKASRIEARHLTSFTPTDFTSCSIAMRFSWASLRETTVEEDETYSLLGLFGISLPLIYGEGRWRAFNRLQRELITVYNDDSIFAWKIRQPISGRLAESHEKAKGNGRGLLAPSIREYWDASRVKAFGLFDKGFSMTNKGLEIHAKRWRRKDNLAMCLIRLNCGFATSEHLAIPLEQTNDTYERLQLHEIYNMEMLSMDEWEEEHSAEPTVIRASNYSSVSISTSIFTLAYPPQIKVGQRYFVDFNPVINDMQRKLCSGPPFRQGFTQNEIVLEPNRLTFINIELQSEGPSSKFDVIVNLSDRSFPSVGILARAHDRWDRLGDPLDQTSGTYEGLANHLHYQVEDDPAYPVTSTAEREDTIIGVCLLPKPRKQRPLLGNADRANSATSREYLLKITSQENGQFERPVPNQSNKRRRIGY